MVKEDQKLNLNPIVIAQMLKKKVLFTKTEETDMLEDDSSYSGHPTPDVDDGSRACPSTPVSDGEPEDNPSFEPFRNNQVNIVDNQNDNGNEHRNICVQITNFLTAIKNWFTRWLILMPLFIWNLKICMSHLICCSRKNIEEEQEMQEFDGDIFQLFSNKTNGEDRDNNSLESLESDASL